MRIRREMPEDADGIDRVHREAFGGEDEAQLVRRLRSEPGFDAHLSLVAEEGGEITGHVLFFPVGIEGSEGAGAVALAPLAVRPDHQRQGVGSALTEAGLVAARDVGHRLVVVLGNPAYYARFGFRTRTDIEPPDPSWVPNFQALALRGGLEGIRGTVVYPPPFEGL